MKRLIGLSLGLCLVSAGIGALAQDMSGGEPPPKVLVIQREFVKPGKGGAIHEKSESAFVQAMRNAKASGHYIAASAMTGRPRVLFFTGYDSFDAWEKDNASVEKNTALSAALDHATLADGELLSDADQTVATFSEEQSLRPNVDMPHMRFLEISLFRIKPGHGHDWEEIVKLVKAAYQKVPDAHWATFEVAYGLEGTTYLVFSGLKSLAEVDREDAQDKDFMANMGEDGMKKLGELEAAAIEFRQTNLFALTPSMSYPPDEWIKADSDFWKPKMPARAKPMEAKPEKEKPKQ